MTRWPALALVALVAVLAGAASTPRAPDVPDELLPTMPWPPPAAAAPAATPAAELAAATATTASPTSPASVHTLFARMLLTPPPPTRMPDAAHLSTRELPAMDVIGTRASAQSSDAPAHLHLERLLAGEEVEGWTWDADLDAEPSAETLRQSAVDDSLSFGFDGRMQRTTAKNEQGDYIEAVMVGPNMRWRPSRHTQLEFSPLVGIGSPYPMSEAVVVFGWKF